MSCEIRENVKITDYDSSIQPTWCSGCGDFAIWGAFKRALVKLNLTPQDVLLCFDIGCNGNMSDKIRGYRAHGLHGRVLPFAAAAKIANPNVRVIAFAGDGATYSEGISHFVNSIRANYPITFFVHNNGDYGLTKGQASATTPQGAYRSASPTGPAWETLNPLELALSLNPSFVGRGFSGDINGLTDLMVEAIQYQDKGFAYVDILQSCPTYNKEQSHVWYLDKVKKVGSFSEHSCADIQSAKRIVHNTEADIPLGVIYTNEQIPTYLDRIKYRKERSTTLVEEVAPYNVDSLLQKFS